MSIADLRREYNLTGLRRADLCSDPISQFQKWFEDATGARSVGRIRKFFVRLYKAVFLLGQSEQVDLNAMTLATVDAQGQPSARIVLLKGVDQRGFIFYTNYNSRKGSEIAVNAHVALVFYWPDLEREVTAAGTVAKLPERESDAYFHSRPRGSQIAAWASDQSRPIADRKALEANWKRFETQCAGREVPRPPHWGGYLVTPVRIEFWQGRPNRMHDRFRYSLRAEGGWTIERISP